MLYGRSTSIIYDVMAVILRRKYIILVAILIAVAVTAVSSFFRPIEYRADATLILKFGREYIYRPEVGEDAKITPFDVEEAINGEVQILNSRSLKELVIDTVGMEQLTPWVWSRSVIARGLDALIGFEGVYNAVGASFITDLLKKYRWNLTETKLPPRERALKFLKYALSITTTKKSPTIHVSFDHWDKDIAVQVLDVLIDGYLRKRLQILGTGPLPFFDKKLEEFRTALDDPEQALMVFKQQHEVSDVEQEIRLLMQRSVDLKASLNAARHEIEKFQAQIEFLRQGPTPVNAKVPVYSDQEVAQMRYAAERLLSLRLQEEQLLAKYEDGTRPVLETRREMDRVYAFLEEQRQIGLQRLKLELLTNQKRHNTLSEQLATTESELQRLESLRPELHTLKRAVEHNENDYRMYSAKVEEERAARSLDEQRISNVRIVQPPVTAPEQIGLPPDVKILIGGIIGFFVGLVLAFLAEWRRNALVTEDNVIEKLNLPVLAAVPEMKMIRST